MHVPASWTVIFSHTDSTLCAPHALSPDVCCLSAQKGKASPHLALPAAPTKADLNDKLPASLRKMLALKVRPPPLLVLVLTLVTVPYMWWAVWGLWVRMGCSSAGKGTHSKIPHCERRTASTRSRVAFYILHKLSPLTTHLCRPLVQAVAAEGGKRPKQQQQQQQQQSQQQAKHTQHQAQQKVQPGEYVPAVLAAGRGADVTAVTG